MIANKIMTLASHFIIFYFLLDIENNECGNLNAQLY